MNKYRQERLITIARSLSHLRTGKSLHFSFILNKNQLLVTSVNSYKKSHLEKSFGRYFPTKATEGSNYFPALHSEIAAIREYINRFGNSDFTGLTLFNVRVGVDGSTMLAKPCDNCQRVLNSFSFKEINWTK